jgi:hypothetical protein
MPEWMSGETGAGHRSSRKYKIHSELPTAIAVVGLLIIASALITVIFVVLPLRLGQPDWQLTFIGWLLSVSINLLIGIAMICVASLADQQSRTVEAWYQAASRFASVLAGVMLLTVPWQIYAGIGALSAQNAQARAALKDLETIQLRIRQTDSEAALRGYVGSLPNPPQLPARFDAPFAVIRQRAVENLQVQINTGITLQKQQQSERLQLFLKEALRNTIQAILMAAGFARIAQVEPGKSNPVTRMFDRMPGWR